MGHLKQIDASFFIKLYTIVNRSVMIDFEQSVIGASYRVYTVVPQKGCLFHLSNNIYKRVQHEGLSQLYRNDDVPH